MAEPLRVVTSLYPLTLMVNAIVGNDVSVTTLLKPGVTPHNFAFRVSERRVLNQADLIIWVGPEFEPYLGGILGGQARAGEHVSMEAIWGVSLPEQEGHTEHHDHKHSSLEHAEHSDHDPHLWLSIKAGTLMLQALAEAFANHNPQKAAEYRLNAAREIDRLEAIEEIKASAATKHYAAIHPAFGHLVDELNLPEPMVLSGSPDVPPSARSLWQLSQTLTSGDCLLQEWPATATWPPRLAKQHGYSLKTIDIIGFEGKANTYSELIENLVAQIKACVQ